MPQAHGLGRCQRTRLCHAYSSLRPGSSCRSDACRTSLPDREWQAERVTRSWRSRVLPTHLTLPSPLPLSQRGLFCAGALPFWLGEGHRVGPITDDRDVLAMIAFGNRCGLIQLELARATRKRRRSFPVRPVRSSLPSLPGSTPASLTKAWTTFQPSGNGNRIRSLFGRRGGGSTVTRTSP